MIRTLAFCLFLQFSFGNALGQINRPPVGRDIDETRIVSLLNAPPSRCMSFEAQDMLIILDLGKAELDAKFNLDRRWKTEEERIAITNAISAREILKSLTDERDELGCQKLRPIEHRDAIEFVANALENGQAAIYKPSIKAAAKYISVRYSGFRAGPLNGRGEILFYIPSEFSPFFRMLWWIS